MGLIKSLVLLLVFPCFALAFNTRAPLDDFNRANTGPPPSASWTGHIVSTETDGLQVVSNVITASGGTTQASGWWNVSSFPADQAASLLLTDIVGSGNVFIRLFVRLAQPGVASQADGYVCRFQPDSTSVVLRRLDNSAESTLTTISSVTYTVSDRVGCEMIGSRLCAWKTVSNVWTQLGCFVDATYTAGGFAGVALNDAAANVDDFWAGPALAPRRPFWLGWLFPSLAWAR